MQPIRYRVLLFDFLIVEISNDYTDFYIQMRIYY